MAEAWPTLLFRYNAPGVWQLLGRDVNAPALIALVVGCLAGGFASVILSRMFIECGLHQIFPCFFDGTSAGGDPAAQRYSRLRPTRQEKLARVANGSNGALRSPLRSGGSSRRF